MYPEMHAGGRSKCRSPREEPTLDCEKKSETRMHSIRIVPTAVEATGGGKSLFGGSVSRSVSVQGGLYPGGSLSRRRPPPVNKITDTHF